MSEVIKPEIIRLEAIRLEAIKLETTRLNHQIQGMLRQNKWIIIKSLQDLDRVEDKIEEIKHIDNHVEGKIIEIFIQNLI